MINKLTIFFIFLLSSLFPLTAFGAPAIPAALPVESSACNWIDFLGSTAHVNSEIYAMDFNCDDGSDFGRSVLAILPGTIHKIVETQAEATVIGRSGCGIHVDILYKNTGTSTDNLMGHICHLNNISSGVLLAGEGSSVFQGQILGNIGTTALTPVGAHLHFSLWNVDNTGNYISPFDPKVWPVFAAIPEVGDGGGGGTIITPTTPIGANPLGPIKLNVNYPSIPLPGGSVDLNEIITSGRTISIGELVIFVFGVSLWLGAIIAFISLVYAGILYIFSGEIPAKRAEAKHRLENVTWGMAILLFSFGILTIINPRLTNLTFTPGTAPDICAPGESCIPRFSIPEGPSTTTTPGKTTTPGDVSCTLEGKVLIKALHPELGESLDEWDVTQQTGSPEHGLVVQDWGGDIGRALRYLMLPEDPKHSSGWRTELHMRDHVRSANSKRLYTREIYIPSDWDQGVNPSTGPDRVMHQWHTGGGLGGWSPIFALRQWDGNQFNIARKKINEKWGPTDGPLNAPIGQWVQERVEVYWTTEDDGYLLWSIGDDVFRYDGPTMLDNYSIYEKTGIYHQPTKYYERNHEIWEFDTSTCETPGSEITTSPLDIVAGSSVPIDRLTFLGECRGFGQSTIGGALGEVYVVTSLNNSGPGSLREGATAGNKWIIFGVNGSINLTSEIFIAGNTTIDGRGADITITNRGLDIQNVDNVIIENIKIISVGSDDSIGIGQGVNNFWVDHVTIKDTEDGFIDIVSPDPGGTRGTVSWSLFEPGGKYYSKLTMIVGGTWVSPEGYGPEYNDKMLVTLHHNFYDYTDQRHPSAGGARVHSYNNVIGWGLYGINAKAQMFDSKENTIPEKSRYGQVYSGGDMFLGSWNPTGTWSGRPKSENGMVYTGSAGGGYGKVVDPWFLTPDVRADEKSPEKVFNPDNYYSCTVEDSSPTLRTKVENGAGWRSASEFSF